MSKTKVITGNRIKLEDDVQESNVQEKKIGSTRAVFDSFNDFESPKPGSVVLMDIPISMIKSRGVNKFIMSDIEQLADNIRKNGLLQNIIVCADEVGDDEPVTFTVVVGHRRVAAFRMLYEKYGDEYKYISANVMNKDDTKEKNAYLDSNGQTRKLTIFEVIANLDPEFMNFNNKLFKDKYVEFMYGDDEEKMKQYEKGELDDNFDTYSLGEYCSKLIAKVYPSFECSSESARKYLRLYNSASPELLNAIYANKIRIVDAFRFQQFTFDEQREILSSANPLAELDFSIKKKNEQAKKEKKAKTTKTVKAVNNDVVDEHKKFDSLTNKINKHIDSLAILCKGVADLSDSSLASKKDVVNNLYNALIEFRSNIK